LRRFNRLPDSAIKCTLAGKNGEGKLANLGLNLLIGAMMITLTVGIQTAGFIQVTHFMGWMVNRFRWHGRRNRVLALITVVYGVFILLTVEVWAWAVLYDLLGVVGDFPSALYFSTVTFSTVGYGDVIAHSDWRMLAALEGINGFMMIGWSTAYLVAAGIRVGPFRHGEHF